MALTLAVYAAAQVAVPFLVRPHLVPAVTQTVEISQETMAGLGSHGGSDTIEFEARASDPSDWVIANETIDADGRVSGLPAWFGDCMPGPPRAPTADAPAAGVENAPADSLDSCLSRLGSEGYRQRLVVQPVSHFWPLQWAETGLYAGASALLAGLSFWWTRRRLS